MDTLQVMLQRVYSIRGQMLQYAIEIETLFDIYISEHFTKDETKLTELIALVIAPRVSFENKFQIFMYLMTKYNPEFKNALTKFKTDLPTIIEMRNLFAHFPVEFSEEYQNAFIKDGTISFIKLKNHTTNGVAGLATKATFSSEDVDMNLTAMKSYAENLHRLVGH